MRPARAESPEPGWWRATGPARLGKAAALTTVYRVVTPNIIERAGKILAESAPPTAKVILFGSCARGDARPGSDLDFLVIEPEVERPRAESARLRCALLDVDAPIDVIVVSSRHVEEWGGVEGTLVHTALTEGRVLSG